MRPSPTLTTLACGAFAALAVATTGCDDAAFLGDASVPDMAMVLPPGDMTAPPGSDLTPGPDMAMSPDMVVLAGTAILLDVVGNFPVPMGDAGVVAVQAHSLFPLLTLGPKVPHQFDNRTALGTGCFADHYDLAADGGVKPVPDVDDGTIVFKKYTGGTLLNGVTAPSEIDCILDRTIGAYSCGYGPVTNGTLGPDPRSAPFMPGVAPVMTNDPLDIHSTGGTVMGPFQTGATDAVAQGIVTVDENLDTISYSSAPDGGAPIHYHCPNDTNATCTLGLVLTNMYASEAPLGTAGFPGGSYGILACVDLTTTGTTTIPKEAIQTMLGSNTRITQVQTRIVRGPLPNMNLTDSHGNGITADVAQGVFGVAAYP
jgi:hypothetical protein